MLLQSDSRGPDTPTLLSKLPNFYKPGIHTGDKVDIRQNRRQLKSTLDLVAGLLPVCRKSTVAGSYDSVDRVAVDIVDRS